MLEIADLRVSYGRIPALHGISLHVDTGEAVAIVGPNGAGKTTTLSAIFGLVAPAAGTIVFEGASLVGSSPERILRRGLALVPEGRHIFGTLTVGENLQLGTTARRDRAEAAVDLRSVLERFPVLKAYYGRTAATLSGGEQQQLAIARALLSRPRLLLLDEPSLGLAPVVIDVVFDALEELRREGVTILLVEQNAARAVEFADRAYILRTGRVAHAGTREEILQMEDFETAYLGV
ncbi:MAG TPA: ABC transporter ATP-binding protein [Gaiellaceae bacterium]|jgi:branched-chain amino acid transport system ATP-binding protein|nr:ABC transporter ATP-binding protein [Gaiellaceae bacterium]